MPCPDNTLGANCGEVVGKGQGEGLIIHCCVHTISTLGVEKRRSFPLFMCGQIGEDGLGIAHLCVTWPWLEQFLGAGEDASNRSPRRPAPHSSTLAWKIPWTEEPGGLQSMRLLSQTRLSNLIFTFHFHTLEKEMATHSSVLAWRIPGMGEPGGLPSLGSHQVGHD